MRITTNMIMRNYQSSLTDSLERLQQMRQQVESERRFSKFSEDPSAATSASIIERKYIRNKSYLNTITEVQSRQDSQEDATYQLNTAVQEVIERYSVEALNDPSGPDGRKSLGAAVREMQKSMVNILNAQYGDDFVLGGTQGGKAPFELSADGKTLTYRGIDVETTDPAEQALLKQYSQDHTYVDLGFGLKFGGANNDVVSSSAFDTSLPGINLVGYGQEADGTSNNIVLLMGQMADELEKDTFDQDAYRKLWTKLGDQSGKLTDTLATLGTKTNLLESTKERLTNLDTALTKEWQGLVKVDSAEAITNMSWANYAYNTALKVGTNIISPSLLDFMK